MKDIMKTLGLILFAFVAMANSIYAKGNSETEKFVIEYNFEEDAYNGPGIGLKVNTWDGSLVNRIYGYGDLNNIIGDDISSDLTYSCDAPGTNILPSKVYNAVGPGCTINGFTSTEVSEYVDMGPQVSSKVVDPSNYVKILNAKPSDIAEACVPLANAKKKDKSKEK